MNGGDEFSDSVRRSDVRRTPLRLPWPARRCRTGSRCDRRRSRPVRPGTACTPAAARSLDQIAEVGADPRFRCASRALVRALERSNARRAATPRAVASHLVGVGSPSSMTRFGRLCAVNTTCRPVSGAPPRTRSANAREQQRMRVIRMRRARAPCRPASAAAAARVVLADAQRRELRRERDARSRA